ncbi:hypothetical protein ACWGJ9_10885 [Curtobacterium citreum]
MSGTTPLPSEEQMRALGFTDHREGHWYLCRRVGSDTTLNVSIEKTTGRWREDVLNEFFGQPEFYESMREPFRTDIRANIDAILVELAAAGITVTVVHDQYRLPTH